MRKAVAARQFTLRVPTQRTLPPLSPLLSKIVLDELDRELGWRGPYGRFQQCGRKVVAVLLCQLPDSFRIDDLSLARNA